MIQVHQADFLTAAIILQNYLQPAAKSIPSTAKDLFLVFPKKQQQDTHRLFHYVQNNIPIGTELAANLMDSCILFFLFFFWDFNEGNETHKPSCISSKTSYSCITWSQCHNRHHQKEPGLYKNLLKYGYEKNLLWVAKDIIIVVTVIIIIMNALFFPPWIF